MSTANKWIEDVLGAPDGLNVIRTCGKGCAERDGSLKGMIGLRDAAAKAGCITDADYASYLKRALPIVTEEIPNGIRLRLGKTGCTCPLSSDIQRNREMLCECTKGHETAAWSIYYGHSVNIEIAESILRGGKDCVISILY